MAHNVETMAYAGEVPWHGLGVPVSNDLTPNQMMKKAGLDWTVEQIDSYVTVGDKKIPTGMKALVRSSDNKVLTNIGQVWNPVQNEDAFNFFSEYVLKGDMEMHTAGSLKGGQLVWALAKVKESFDLFGGDTVESYLLFSNPHKYGFSIDVRFTPIRVVCNNTLSLSLEAKAERSVKVGHRTEFNADEVKKALGIASAKLSQYKEMAEFLGSKRYNIDNLIEYYNTVFPRTADKRVQNQELSVETLSKNAKAAFDAIELQPGAKYAEGSWWQAFNSVTYVTDHLQGRNPDNRLYSSWFGGNQIRKRDALKTALEFAEVA
jgi:phage/plasmid-like protein (TIGR03299 family)|tara:strand:- start:243 stop:1199 length:957 start_codon:yes stop_codon:yes gene_type:complete